MIRVVLEVRSEDVIGVKETLADYCERFGDTRVRSVELVGRDQVSMTFDAQPWQEQQRKWRNG